jgi:hypothetical protein
MPVATDRDAVAYNGRRRFPLSQATANSLLQCRLACACSTLTYICIATLALISVTLSSSSCTLRSPGAEQSTSELLAHRRNAMHRCALIWPAVSGLCCAGCVTCCRWLSVSTTVCHSQAYTPNLKCTHARTCIRAQKIQMIPTHARALSKCR